MSVDRQAIAAGKVTPHLKAVHFPCDRDGLLVAARAARAPDRVPEVLRRIESRAYEGMAQVSQEVAHLHFDEAGRIEPAEEASPESFPASDAPGFGAPSGVGRPRER